MILNLIRRSIAAVALAAVAVSFPAVAPAMAAEDPCSPPPPSTRSTRASVGTLAVVQVECVAVLLRAGLGGGFVIISSWSSLLVGFFKISCG